jgi:hypothetical protein
VDQGKAHTSFSQLVRAHYNWAKQLHGRRQIDEAAKEQYEKAIVDFERGAGTIIEAYWCLKDASAVAMTERGGADDAGWLSRLMHGGRESELRLHRVTDWVTADAPALADLLHVCDILAIKASEGLSGTPKRVAMQWILAVETHVLGFVERTRERRIDLKKLQTFVAGERAELEKIEAYINGSGERAARIYYVQGMLLGVIPLVLLGFLGALFLWLFDLLDVHDDTVRAVYLCYVAGAAGAVVSVLSRMGSRRDNFSIDHEIPRWGLYALGWYRPIVGAIFGVAMYFLVQTPILQIDEKTKTFSFFAIVAFLSGFSERWTRVILDGAQNVIAGEGSKPEVTEDDIPTVVHTSDSDQPLTAEAVASGIPERGEAVSVPR